MSEAGFGLPAGGRPRIVSPFALLAGPARAVAAPAPKSRRLRRVDAAVRRRPLPGWGTVLVIGLMAATGLYGAVRGGQYAAYVAAEGAPADLVAKALGFSIDSVTISGLKSLTPGEILRDGGVSARNSLALLDAGALRDRLKAVPLVQDVTVRKLFPGDLHVNVTERDAAAVWQKDGQLSLVATDGTVIDAVRDDRFNALPFVVGDGANTRVGEFQALLGAAGELRDKVRAGVLVGKRRWTLQMDSGIEVELPELDAMDTLKRLADIERQSHILEKDVVSIDLRIPGRITARLTEDAAAARAAMLAKRPKRKIDL
ncbi:cell division protein FtsQ/DivIB [Lichenibacterium dinghuense]|uniref:cell division protein FtsQ/DivIB n=1 Tax=Lichenibacterium dinghuense TaxID=2895977 RepID=UPI001F33CF6B|nr:cell division protein FtsQ/DivIB [Lichenibacterium sp. 6Y81]